MSLRFRQRCLGVLLSCCGFSNLTSGQQPVAPPTPLEVDNPAYCETISTDLQYRDALRDACAFVWSLRAKLPNIICDQQTLRYQRRIEQKSWKKLDTITAHVIYEDGTEHYSDIRVNGRKLRFGMADLWGQYSTGEFGSDLLFNFSPKNNPTFIFIDETEFLHHQALIFGTVIAKANNESWTFALNGVPWYPGLQSEIWLDKTTHQILRYTLKVTEEPEYPVSHISLSTDYTNIPLGDGTEFLLPATSETSSCSWESEHLGKVNRCRRNVLVFTNCHKFAGKARIIEDVTPP